MKLEIELPDSIYEFLIIEAKLAKTTIKKYVEELVVDMLKIIKYLL